MTRPTWSSATGSRCAGRWGTTGSGTKAAYTLLQQLYHLLCRQLSFFRPVRKLVAKERRGAKVIKHYDQPRTPYQRLLISGCLNKEARSRLERELARVNPAALQRQTDALLHQLWRLGQQERKMAENVG